MREFKSLVGEIRATYKTADRPKVKIKSAEDAETEIRKLFEEGVMELREEMVMILLNRANNTLGWVRISQGGVGGTVCDPKVIFSHALIANASGIILAHNHPSGNLKPSSQDVTLTRDLVKSGKMLSIVIVDHLIITREGFYSMAENGEI